jgi:hypothetical protein
MDVDACAPKIAVLEYLGNQARQVCRPLAGGKQQTAIPVTDSARTFA